MKVADIFDDESSVLSNHLYEACNILRGPVSADEYKNYLFPLMFLKRMSDVYDEETALAYEKYGDDAKEFNEDEIHSFIVPKAKVI